MRKLSVVIPCYNERSTIREILSRVFAVSVPDWQFEIIVVDDFSTDGTREILREYESRAKVIYREQNGGKGTAVTDGLQKVQGDFILIQDADLEYDPAEIPTLLGAIGDSTSVVYGSRNLVRRKRTGHVIPRLGVWFITKLINILYKVKLTDVWTCYKLFSRKYAHLFGVGRFDSEIAFTLKVLREGSQIIEVPIGHKPRDISEGKKIRYRDGFYAIWLILRDWSSYSRWFRGLLATLAAAVVLLATYLGVIQPTVIPESDAPSYIEAMNVLDGAPEPAGFVPYRILTTISGLSIVVILSKLFGSYETSWMLMNILFYFGAIAIFYRLIFRLHENPKVAALSALFLGTSYSMLIFGPNYFMDMGGWFFYILTAYFVLAYAQTGNYLNILYAAAATGLGGLFKEYALLGAFIIGFYLIYEHWPSVKDFLGKVWKPAAIVAAPILLLHLIVYKVYGYTYFDWLGNNQTIYVYSSRIIEYVKTLGSMFNILAILTMLGLYYFWKSRQSNPRNTTFVICYFLSTVPIFFWPAITQRITFVFLPIGVILTSYFINRFAHRWYAFLPILVILAAISLTMDAYILNFINLPF